MRRVNRVAAGVLAVTLSGCFYSSTWGKTPHAHEAKFAREHSGAELTLSGSPVTEIHEYRVRFYADADFRSHTPRWKDQMKRRLALMNAFLGPEAGVRLVVADYREWKRDARIEDLEGIVRELRQRDGGDDVDWVIGLVGGESAVTSTIHELGIAGFLSKYMVLRAMDDTAEAKAIDAELRALSKAEKAELYEKRKHHKEAIVFLHEWGHTLGLIHVQDRAWIMNESYSDQQRAFSGYESEHVRLALAARRAKGAEVDKAYARLLEHFEQGPADDWDPGDRALILRELKARAAGASELEAIEALPADERKGYLEAERLTAAEDYASAWSLLAPIAARHQELAPAQLLACQLAAQAAVTAPASRTACEAAAKLMPNDALPLILLAWAKINDHARKEALAAADAALARLQAKDDVPARWIQLAGAYQALSAVSKADLAVTHAPDANGAAAIKSWIAETRLWAAPTGVEPAHEPQYVERFWTLYQALTPSTAKATLTDIDAALKIDHDAPGLLSLRCGALVYLDKLEQAKKACDKAIALAPDTIFARLGAAHIARRQKDVAAARKHLEHVIDVAPDLEQAWTDLAEVLEGDEVAMGKLKRRYREVRKKSWPY